MVRIVGININENKHIFIGLTKIYGIGRSNSLNICKKVGVDIYMKVKDVSDINLEKIRNELSNYNIEGDLRRKIKVNIKRLIDLGCYRGIRHRKKLPVRGQRTRTNARTCKGPRRIKILK